MDLVVGANLVLRFTQAALVLAALVAGRILPHGTVGRVLARQGA